MPEWNTPVEGVAKVLVQYDDEMIIAGSFANLNAVATKPMIRLNADLTWDSGFVTNQGGSFNGSINSMAFQSGGAVVAVGPFTQLNSVTANRVARLQNNDPTPDLSGSGADTGILVVVGLGLLAAQYSRQRRAAHASGVVLLDPQRRRDRRSVHRSS